MLKDAIKTHRNMKYERGREQRTNTLVRYYDEDENKEKDTNLKWRNMNDNWQNKVSKKWRRTTEEIIRERERESMAEKRIKYDALPSLNVVKETLKK